MEHDDKLNLTDIRELEGLSDEQRQRLIDRGVVFVETFLADVRIDAAGLAALLSCTDKELQSLRHQAKQLVAINFNEIKTPVIPPFGLLSPSDRAVQEIADQEPEEGDEK